MSSFSFILLWLLMHYMNKNNMSSTSELRLNGSSCFGNQIFAFNAFLYKKDLQMWKVGTLFRYDFSVTFNFYDSVTFIKTDSSVLSNLFYKKVICQDFVVIFLEIIKYFAKNETFSMKIFLYIFTSLF